MSKLEQLIHELCPDGVEYVRLGECCEFKRGRTITKNTAINGEIPVIAGGQKPAYYHNMANRMGESITVSSSGAYAGFVMYWNEPIFVSDAFTVEPNEKVLVKYVYYFLKSKQKIIYRSKKGGGVPHVHGSDLSPLIFPLPPLPIQHEIVRILDNFTELTAELTAELEKRKKQYEYYRDELLTFGDDVPIVSLKTVAKYSKDRIDSANVDKYTYVGVDNLLQNKQGKNTSNYVPTTGRLTKYYKNDVLIGNIRPYLRKIWFATNDGGTNGDVLVIQTTTNEIIPKYLFMVLCSEKFFNYNMQNAKGAKMPRGSKDSIMHFLIPVPSLPEQKRIVDILDRFDKLCNDISEGLPAEIKARQQQYEYYRDKLLTFERKEAGA